MYVCANPLRVLDGVAVDHYITIFTAPASLPQYHFCLVRFFGTPKAPFRASRRRTSQLCVARSHLYAADVPDNYA